MCKLAYQQKAEFGCAKSSKKFYKPLLEPLLVRCGAFLAVPMNASGGIANDWSSFSTKGAASRN